MADSNIVYSFAKEIMRKNWKCTKTQRILLQVGATKMKNSQ